MDLYIENSMVEQNLLLISFSLRLSYLVVGEKGHKQNTREKMNFI